MSHVWQTLRERFAREVRRAWTQRGTWVAGRGPQIAVAVGLALVVLGTAGFVGVLDAVQENDDLATLDRPVLEGLAASRSEILTVVLTVITTITGPSVLPVIVLLGAVAWGVLGKLEIPGALPVILGGLRNTVSLALIGTIVAEFTLGTNGFVGGLGVLVQNARGNLNWALAFSSVFVLIVIGVTLYLLITLLELWVLRYRRR